MLTLTGTATLASYQTALRSITFSLTSDTPSTATRTVSFQVTDTANAASNVATRNVAVSATNDAPAVRTTAGSTANTEGAAAGAVDAGVTVADPDHSNVASAQARISSGFQAGDQLAFDPQTGISGTYNAATGVLAFVRG